MSTATASRTWANVRLLTLALGVVAVLSLLWTQPADARQSRAGFVSLHSCITWRLAVAHIPPCTTVVTPGESPLRFGTGAIALSPDGNNLYGSGGVTSRVSNFSRDPATGNLSFLDCVTSGDPIAAGPCTPAPALADPSAPTLSRDGRSVYVLARYDRTLVVLARDPVTGTLSFRQCLGGPDLDGSTQPCPALPGGRDHLSLLAEPLDLAVSSDGRSVYAGSYVGGLVEFQRDPATGDLRFQGCLTDARDVEGCRPVRKPSRRPQIDYVDRLIVSPDGKSVYATRGAVILIFRRAADGGLNYRSCITSKVRRTPRLRFRGCKFFPKRHSVRSGKYLHPGSLALAPGGDWLYLLSTKGSLAVFRVGPRGQLKYRACVTANWVARRHCRVIPDVRRDPGKRKASFGTAAVAPDGRHLYAVAMGGSALASFRLFRDGRVRWEGCVRGSARVVRKGYIRCKDLKIASTNSSSSALSRADGLAVSPDSHWIYVSSYVDRSLLAFRR